jgi:hypothetical protein
MSRFIKYLVLPYLSYIIGEKVKNHHHLLKLKTKRNGLLIAY